MAKSSKKKRFKIALGLLLLVIVLLVVLFNKSPINSLVPFNDPIDPWPIQKECPLPDLPQGAKEQVKP